MTDLACKPTPLKHKPVPRWVWWTCGILTALLALLLFVPFYGEASPKSLVVLNRSNAAGIFPALKMYAEDHNGHYPQTLAELEPDYISSVPKCLEDWGGRHYDWFYVPGSSATSPADWILLASPTDQLAGGHGRRERIVLYNHNTGMPDIVPADQFHRQLSAQEKAMAAQAPSKP